MISTRARHSSGVVNEAFVRQIMNGQNPVGRRIPIEFGDTAREIIGVVKDSRYASLKEDTPPLCTSHSSRPARVGGR